MMKHPKRPDLKMERLRKQGTLNPRPQDVTDERFQDSDFFDPRDLVQLKYEMLRGVEKEGQSITQASRAFGLSRPSFYKARAQFTRDGLAGLVPKKRGRKSPHKLTAEVMELIDAARAEDETLKAPALAQRIQNQTGLRVHPRSIERALLRREKKRK